MTQNNYCCLCRNMMGCVHTYVSTESHGSFSVPPLSAILPVLGKLILGI